MDEITRREMEISEFYDLPLLTLVQQAASVHREAWSANAVELCALLSIKTGSCGEDCAYCAQSARYATHVDSHPLLPVEEVEAFARKARDRGVRRACMSAAWSRPPAGEEFERVLHAVAAVKEIGLEACVTLGKLSPEQVDQLKSAGLDYYNHNLDTSPERYSKVISTRTFDDRLKTIAALRGSGIHLCCGGIIGMGETHGAP